MHTYLFHVPIKYIKLTAKRNERERERERGRGKEERKGKERKRGREEGGVHTIFYKYPLSNFADGKSFIWI